MIVRECCRCFDLRSRRLTGVSLVLVTCNSEIPGNCRADELATFLLSDVLNVYTDSYKLDNEVRSGIYSGKLNLNISLRQPDYCSVFKAEVMAINRASQRILTNGVSFTRFSIFSDSQTAIRSLSEFVNNSRIVR